MKLYCNNINIVFKKLMVFLNYKVSMNIIFSFFSILLLLLQMLCYLLMQLADAFEVEATKPSTEVIISGKVRNSYEWKLASLHSSGYISKYM